MNKPTASASTSSTARESFLFGGHAVVNRRGTIMEGTGGGGAAGEDTNAEEPTLSFLSAVELKVFKTFVRNYVETRKLRPEDATALDSVFGPMIMQVLEMLEEEQVFIRQGPLTERVLIEVCGRQTYWVPPGHSVCQCMAYTHGKKEFCKHVLAAHLCLAITPKEKYKEIEEEELSKIYKEVLLDD